jgi:transcriptional regulator with XRE-family HTH domain
MRNLTQKQLASKIAGKLDYTYIGKIERGAQLPSLKVLQKLSDTLAIPLAYFFQDEALTHLLPEELRRLSRDGERRALLSGMARISRGDIPLLTEITRVLDAHRRLKRGQRDADLYSPQQRDVSRAADWTGGYPTKPPGTGTALLRKAIKGLEQIVKTTRHSRQPPSQRTMRALERACRELRRGVTGSS